MKRNLLLTTCLLLLCAPLIGCDSGGPSGPSPIANATSTIAPPGTPTGASPIADATSTVAPSGTPTTVISGTTTGASPEALAYLKYAVDYIQQHALDSDKVDWAAVRAQVFEPGLKAQTTADTYPAISYVLYQLPVHNHSILYKPDEMVQNNKAASEAIGLTVSYAQRTVTKVDTGSTADLAGVRAGDAIVTVNDTPVESLDVTKFFAQLYFGTGVKLGLRRGDSQTVVAQINHDPVDPTSIVKGRRLPGNIGYIALPSVFFSPIKNYFPGITQQIIEDIDQMPTCGWVVDLQGNTGGYIGQMLAAIGPILGEGQVGSFIGPAGNTPWIYRNGQVSYAGNVVAQVDTPYQLKRPNPPVAVLTDSKTNSAGEAVLVAFRGRQDARSFGEATAGRPSVNEFVPLSDGAYLFLTVAKDADRTGRAYEDKIQPDVPVPANSFWRGTDKDSVLQAAIEWIKQQPACARPQ